MKVNTLKLTSEDFPAFLGHIDSPPQQLYWTGAPPSKWLDRPRLAIVGSRKATAYGRNVTERLAGELARQGVVIISGLAYGIDATAHRAALDAHGCTVAVLGTGLDRLYPAAHQQLAQRIVDGGGTLLSEYQSGSEGHRLNFIARNRLISGLAEVVLVAEATFNSGSLHTARFALEQGRTVLAIPGNIDNPSSAGCNNLIKSGALPVTSVDDIFFALNLNPKNSQTRSYVRGTPEEELLYKLISEGVVALEDLALAADLDGPSLNQALTVLEIGGHIRPAGGGNWMLG